MKKQSLLLFLLLFPFFLFGKEAKIKVACVGNSVTYGATLPDREQNSYPARLSMLLGDKYEVKNFGKSGATLLSKGHRPYVEQDEYKEALAYAPDIVVIALGLNDTDPRNWPNYRDEFFRDYLNLIESFRGVNPKAKIYLCRMSPITHEHGRFISGTRDWYAMIQDQIERIASYANTDLIDLESPLFNRPDLLPDALHPNVEGAQILAQTVYAGLTGKYGGLQMPIIYGDNMVLQRNTKLKIQGEADAFEKITVEIGGQKQQTVTSAGGKWQVTLNPLKEGQDYVLKISSPNRVLTYKNVQAGEVWLCSGQSNMAFSINQDVDYDKVKDNLNHPNIRFFSMLPRWEPFPVKWDKQVLDSLNRQEYYIHEGWTPNLDGSVSAVAYYFARMLADSLQVPIGIIQNSVGGSTLESWIDRRTLQYDFPEILNNWTENDLIQDWARTRAKLNLGETDNKNQRHPYEPCYLFESGIIPLANYPINGVIWYQGESNAHNIEVYEKLFPIFVKSWRKHWENPEMPFYFVQLSSLFRPTWTWFRDAQRKLMDTVQNTYMAVSSDRGDSLDVHPRHKKDVGERLAFWCLNKHYNKTHIIPSGPLFRSVEFKNGSALVEFEYGDGLKADGADEIIGFEVAEVDGLYHPAQAEPQDGKLKVWSDEVKNPKYVRYAWTPFTRANLVNNRNLPASTFRAGQDIN